MDNAKKKDFDVDTAVQNDYLKGTRDNNKSNTFLLLTTKEKYMDFKAEIQLLNPTDGHNFGLYFGQKEATSIKDKEACLIQLQDNKGKLYLRGVDGKNTAKYSNKNDELKSNDDNNLTIPGAAGFNSSVNNTNLLTLNVEVKSGTLTAWYTGYESEKFSVQLKDYYQAGYLSLYCKGGRTGGIKSVKFTSLDGFYKTMACAVKQLSFSGDIVVADTYEFNADETVWGKRGSRITMKCGTIDLSNLTKFKVLGIIAFSDNLTVVSGGNTLW